MGKRTAITGPHRTPARTCTGLVALFAGTFLALQALAAAGSKPSDGEGGNPAAMPAALAVLSPADAERYRDIFRLQRKARWREADRIVAKLESRLLIGHVRFQRLMHPTGYRSRFDELRDWMARYADHPGADRIFRLAVRRQPQGARAPRHPELARKRHGYADLPPAGVVRLSSRRARSLARQITRLTRRDRPSQAARLLDGRRAGLSRADSDILAARIAASYFYVGKDMSALEMAGTASRSRSHTALADWIAGLAAWRLSRIEDAQRHFGELARSSVADPWMRAAGAFWAGRAYLIDRKPQKFSSLMNLAADNPRTFYGLIAARLLGRDLPFGWSPPRLEFALRRGLLERPRVRRAIALVQAGESALADQEVRQAYLFSEEEDWRGLLAVAARLALPAMEMRLSRGLQLKHGEAYDGSLYPVPPWQPHGGFDVDRALVYAIIRKESAFNVTARSRMGARGLMQLMPRTAQFVANGRRQGRKLDDPVHNLGLGQRYIAHLMEEKTVRGNLFHLATAYNAGPGNLRRWLKNTDYRGDPLLFVESLPSRETRLFVERVLTNYWIYRERLRQDTPSLDAVATGNWPIYLSLDSRAERLGRPNTAGRWAN